MLAGATMSKVTRLAVMELMLSIGAVLGAEAGRMYLTDEATERPMMLTAWTVKP